MLGRELEELRSYRVTELFENLSFCFGALPLYLRKGFAFPANVAGSSAAPPPPGRHSLKGLGNANGKAELFRT
jgi:hypothetical protein